MEFETILFQKDGAVATVTINRPKVLNAINDQVISDLIKCFQDIQYQKEIRGVIVTGAGDKAFVAGADIASMQTKTALDARNFVEAGHRCMRLIETCDVPVIAAVNGFALGGGMELALSCDFIYASSTAKLGLPEVNLGLYPGFGGTQRLARLIGKNKAKELIYSAKVMSAEDAFQLGIVNKVVEPDQLMDAVKKSLGIILKKGPIAVSLAKKVINEGADLPLPSGLALEETTFPLIFATEDRNEGVSAFLEKREAKFIGK